MREIEITVRFSLYDRLGVERDDMEAEQVREAVCDRLNGWEEAPFFGVEDCAVTEYEI